MDATGWSQGQLANRLNIGENYLSRIKTDEKFEVPDRLMGKLERLARESPDVDLLPWPDDSLKILAHDWARKCNLHVHVLAVKCMEKFGEQFAEELAEKLAKAKASSAAPSPAGGLAEKSGAAYDRAHRKA